MPSAPVTIPAVVQWRCLPFAELSGEALYELLRLRSRVFVVEQQCIFLDMDGMDAACLHVLGETVGDAGERKLVASTRLVPAGVAFGEASIGRVVTAPEARSGGLGHALMAESLQQLTILWGQQPVRIGAQAHLENFYNRHGFVSDNKPYIEDGIAHIEMIRP
ncbi:GNAT family N-acetyltransferase [Hydrogenophaga sp. PAMC20947]|uniref:GNAT family N-acetyltransferase n=1 Tax=Hydrogenophaga sp. PAMC20947 TaxID=2565558 RepID=UPI001B351270|nr:GNAT family N-acetyltransferase [Hydrogenophaga sp. PAMC20947]